MLALDSNWAPLVNAMVHYVVGDFDQMLTPHGVPAFRAQRTRMIGLINGKRAEFGMAPLE